MLKYFFVSLALLYSPLVFSQKSLIKTVKEHYRVDPFHGSFSAFVKAFSTDTALQKKEILLQTDTSTFYAGGQYTVFNPFDIDADAVEVAFFEQGANVQGMGRFSQYNYQITGYFPHTERSLAAVKKNYKKLIKGMGRNYQRTVAESIGGKSSADGEIISFFFSRLGGAPISFSWQKLNDSNQIALTILLRLQQQKNELLPVHIPRSLEDADIPPEIMKTLRNRF